MRIVAVCLLVALCFGQDQKPDPNPKKASPQKVALVEMDAASAAIAGDRIHEAIERLQKAIGALQGLITKGLETFVPKAPAGWRREKIRATSGNWGTGANVMQWHQVTCRYVSEAGAHVELTISNSPQIVTTSRKAAEMYMKPGMVAMMNQGKNKVEAVKSDGWIGWIVSNRGRRATMTVMEQKVLVVLASSTGDFGSVKKFWDLFPRKECAAANK